MSPAAFGQDWNGDGTNLYYNGGNVGIGTSSPGVALDVSGAVRASNGINPRISRLYQSELITEYPRGLSVMGSESQDGWDWKRDASTVLTIRHPSYQRSTQLLLSYKSELFLRKPDKSGAWKNWVRVLTEDEKTGNVGVGTGNPSHKLEVSGGSARAEDFIPDNGHYFPNRETSDYTSSMKGHKYTYLVWDRNNGGGPFEAYDRPQFMYWDNDGDGTLRYLIDSGNMKNLNARFATLAVEGDVLAEEVVVALSESWPDFVFSDAYRLPMLREVARHIDEKGHLPDIPSAKEVERDGVRLGQMDAKLLQKIEELTLYAIEREEQVQALQEANAHQQQQIDAQQQQIDRLHSMIETLQATRGQ